MKKPFIIHPFLFAIFPILFLFSHNIDRAVSFSETLLPVAIALGFTLLLVLLSRLILRDNKKAGIIVSIFLVLFFSYGHVHDMMWGRLFIGKHRYLLPTWGILFACGAYFTIRTRRDLRNFTSILDIVAFSLVVVSLLNIGVYEFKTRGAWQYSRSTEDRETNTTDLGDAATLRDIYYIILDGYASSSTLKAIYGYDNHEFTDYLTEKGFYIASKSRSNYAFTRLSLASSLNMEYINYLSDVVGVEWKDLAVPSQMVDDSKVMNLLKSKGYKYIHFSSGSGPTNFNKYADLEVQCRGLGIGGDEFTMVLMQTTMLQPLNIGVGRRAKVLCTFSRLAEVHRIEGPKFVFAHIMCPHPPYVFGANGEPVPKTELKFSGDWDKEKYLNQLIFVNKKVEVLVDEILLSKSEVSPIIILQADHGPYSTFPDGSMPDRPTEKMLREAMRIFNAYYLPSNGNDLLYDSITPVNTFRLVFNFYFDANYKLLDDQSYYSPSGHPYKFMNVTDKVDYD